MCTFAGMSSIPMEKVSAADQPKNLKSDYSLVWSDEFEGNSLDSSNWNYDIGGGLWGNNESEYYTDSTKNVSVQDGMLKITAMQENKGGYQYTSGRITTEGKQDFTYGYMEARMKLPNGQGLWPAFWMLGSGSGWPECGEIDIMEHINSEPTYYGTCHYLQDGATNVTSLGSQVWNISGYDASQWHTYAIDWTSD